ncbi:DinB family protein [Mucilaginibacter sp. RS28]|uniref:DinB family protein n=1 Tax=Mucilaginibacter straminoryzae TaxID=2932774 RepID=A0A9X2BCY5_9SPHI|nr:DinB family protein [Mucilaginibacter straminoryzae]MCJ8211502.1 DinB family protein [Mucilaginibacter straminoryzae]
MNKPIEIIRKTREHVLKLIEGLSIEELNKVPANFNNNIIWNMGHMVAAQQGVCYRRAGLELHITPEFFELYKPESKPERFITVQELEEIKTLFFSTIDFLEQDYQNGCFDSYVAWTTRYGVAIDGIDDAITFLPFHEGMHTGYIMALKRAIKS